MIVVVVVALSTATYAWFTSTSTSTASMTIASTTASEWQLSKGTVNESAGVTFSSQSTMLTLDSGLNGLYAPNKELTIKPSSDKPTAVTLKVGDNNTASEAFYQCNTYNGAAYVTTASAAKTPTIIRVVNNKAPTVNAETKEVTNDGSQTCTVTVLVVLTTDNANSRYAAAALTFYFASASKTYTLGYNYADASSITAIGKDDFTDSSKTAAVAAAKIESSTEVDASGLNNNAKAPAYATVTAGGATSGFKTASTETVINSDITLAEKQTFLAYSFTTESLASGSGVNLVNYTWINGWVADDGANMSEITVYYIFGAALTDKIPTANADPV